MQPVPTIKVYFRINPVGTLKTRNGSGFLDMVQILWQPQIGQAL
jgi:hypothetical protein